MFAATKSTADVPLPPGAQWPDAPEWQRDEPHDYRVVFGAERGIEGEGATAQTSALQWADGSIDAADDVPVVRVVLTDTDRGLTGAQARALAAVLIECADELDGWIGA